VIRNELLAAITVEQLDKLDATISVTEDFLDMP
jgi:hypothetical protein